MALRCIIGHDYGPSQTSRDTRERGNEVVVTVREYRECSRCGHQRIISENKEVTARGPDAPAEESTEDSPWAAEDAGTADATVDLGSTGPSGGVGEHEELSAEEDDGIILEDEPEASTRARGEWPEDDRPAAAAGTDADHAPWPDEGEGDDATVDGDDADAVVGSPSTGPDDDALDAGGQATGGDAPAGTDAPDDGGGEIIDAEAHAAAAAEAAAPGADAPDADRPAKLAGQPEARPDGRDTEFVCPECGETWPTVDASLRPGDICPSCRQGYLVEQVVQ